MFKKIIFVTTIILLVGAIFFLGVDKYLTIDFIKEQQSFIKSKIDENIFIASITYGIIFITFTSLSIPGATVLSLGAGAFFGIFLGTLIVSFASTIGATIAFIIVRFLAGNSLQKKYANRLKVINTGMEKEGAFYLFALRLLPVFPFFLINILMAFTRIPVFTFFVVSQIGMLPGTLAYVYAGTALSEIDSLQNIISKDLIIAFSIIAFLPLVAKRLVNSIRVKRVYSGFKKPKKFDYNIVVIGAGAAGLVVSYIASAVKAKVALIEKNKMGGDCLNYGCVPSKALIRSAHIADYIKRSREFGIKVSKVDVDFKSVMERIQAIIKKIEPNDSVERYTKLGVNCIEGEAKIIDPWSIRVNEKKITAKNIVIAAGGAPLVPKIPGLEKIKYVTSDNVWDLRQKPERMIVLGGGPIGCELSQAFSRLGVEITQVELADQVLIREDDDVIEIVKKRFAKDGIEQLTKHRAVRFDKRGKKQFLICDYNGKEVAIEFDIALLALGRQARTKGYGLEELGVDLTSRNTINANEYLQTKYPNIYVAGDIVGPYQFTHVAAHQAWYACVNALFGAFKKFSVDYRVVPWCTFTDPEVARVGHNEKSAKANGIEYEVTTFGMDDLDRAITEGEDQGIIKVLTEPGKDKILGVTIVGYQAGEILSEYVLAMKHSIGLNKILSTIHAYPTMSEANKYVSGEWKKAHTPSWLFKWLTKFHSFQRGVKND